MDRTEAVVAEEGQMYYLQVQDNIQGGTTTLNCRKFMYDRNNCKWSSATYVVSHIISEPKLRILDAKFCQNSTFHDTNLCCVMGYSSGVAIKVYVCVVSCTEGSQGKIHLDREIHQTVEAQDLDISAWVVGGNRLIIAVSNSVYLTSTMESGISSNSLELLPVTGILKIWHVGGSTLDTVPHNASANAQDLKSYEFHHELNYLSTICLLCTQQIKDICDNIKTFLVNITLDSNSKVMVLDPMAIPQCYVDSVVAACLFENSNQCLVLTHLNQIMTFKQGVLQACTILTSLCVSEVLEASPSCRIALKTYTDFAGKENVVVHLEGEKTVLVLSAKDLNIKQKYVNVEYLAIDDFTQCGAQEMLIIDETLRTEFCITNFAITDMKRSNHFVTDSESEVQIEESSENTMLSVVEALESRVQAGHESLARQKQLILVKEGIIHKACVKLGTHSDLSKDNKLYDIDSTNSSLVTLFDGRLVSDKNAIDEQPAFSQHPECRNGLIHHVIGTDVIIGARVLCINSGVTDAQLNVRLCDSLDGQLMYSCTVFNVSTFDCNKKGCKRQKLEVQGLKPCRLYQKGESILFLARVPLLSFVKPKQEYTVSLTWNQTTLSSNSLRRLSRSDENDHLSHTLLCGKVAFPVLVESEDYTSISKDYLPLLTAVQQETNLTVQSKHYGNVMPLLQAALAKVGCKHISEVGMFANKRKGHLHLTRCFIKTETFCRLNLTVWTRDNQQLSIFLHTLYANLPEDMIITTCCNRDDPEKLSQALLSITQEAVSSCDSIRELVMEPKHSGDLGLGTEKITEFGGGIKKFFPEKRRLSHANIEISREKYKIFVKLSDLASVKSNTCVSKIFV